MKKEQLIKIEKYLYDESKKVDNEAKERCDKKNSKACLLCGSFDFVQKFRNVQGYINGKITGNYSLFGGSISGYIDGNTETLPVLACKNCGNERKVATWTYTYQKEMFWDDMLDFYGNINKDETRKIKKIYLENPIGTREYMLANKNYDYLFYNDMAYWSIQTWEKAGFIFPISTVKKTKILFWTINETYNWDEYIELINNYERSTSRT